MAGYADFGFGPIGSGGLDEDAFITMMERDAGYAPRWARGYGPLGLQEVTSLALTSDESVVVTGSFSGTLDFDAGLLMAAGNRDIYLAKVSPSGDTVFSAAFGSLASETVYGLALGPNDEVVIVGQLGTSPLSFGGTALTTAGGADAFIARFDAAGHHQWSARYGNSLSQAAKAVAIQRSPFVLGQTVVAGDFQGMMNLASGTLTSAGGQDIFLVCFDEAGNALWGRRFGDSADQRVNSIAVDPLSGQIAVTGTFQGTIDFGGSALTSDAGWDGYVAVFTPGSFTASNAWSTQLGGGDDQQGLSVAFDYSGNLLTAGSFRGSLTLGSDTRTSAGGRDFFVSKHSASGTLLWLETGGDEADQELTGVTADTLNRVRVTGTFAGTTTLDGVPHPALGAADAFIGELRP